MLRSGTSWYTCEGLLSCWPKASMINLGTENGIVDSWKGHEPRAKGIEFRIGKCFGDAKSGIYTQHSTREKEREVIDVMWWEDRNREKIGVYVGSQYYWGV